ncbi:LLM class F420-dependent oxidoreductase [Sanguibacter hominis ATCC BAA-789]|uniref:LLM class F420-dependent oxidoreductase n=1 Tax=Sanguibacter hominis ATCC BAA-789 TaxID=1312740 RepID=A0A9X5F8S4_9MICO|nr:LLM class F420-dependent oxidoreductase [Sanguibacter hominis]NKX91871.1 LLM class F420-dependent oxidoreductase [Sanguibacter hominis ATCC BAA-789]
MRFGLHTGYWSAGPPPGVAEAVRMADTLGLDSVWTAEAYGSDAFTPLAWWGAATSRVRLGTAVAQMYARTPTATAMAALTLDHLSGGRAVLGLGASGPQVVEGWYGQPFRRPLARTREFVDIVRQVIARERVQYDGQFFRLPLPEPGPDAGPDAPTGLGRALHSTVRPLRPAIPIHLAAEGPKNVALAGEIADGWLPLFYAPRLDAELRGPLEEGLDRRSAARSPRETFEVCATVPIVVRDDVEEAADQVRPFLALYIGGMGAKGANFHLEAVARLGYREVCDDVQRLYLGGLRAEAAAAIPLELVRDVALVGTLPQVAAGMAAWESTAVTTMLFQADEQTLRALASAPGLLG